jgi:hypothetical protein
MGKAVAESVPKKTKAPACTASVGGRLSNKCALQKSNIELLHLH